MARYDIDWSATGPLIEKYGISIIPTSDGWLALSDLSYKYDYPNVDGESLYCIDVYGVNGETEEKPLMAVCNLILALHAAGKLKEKP